MTRNWKDHGIIFSNPNNLKKLRIRCPDCSETRLNHPSEKCMTIDVDNGFYHCYHCGKSGYVPTEEEIEEFAKQLKEAGIKVNSLGSPIGKYDIVDDFEPHFERFKKACKTAQILGTKNMRMFSFFIPDGEEAMKYKKENYQLIFFLLC